MKNFLGIKPYMCSWSLCCNQQGGFIVFNTTAQRHFMVQKVKKSGSCITNFK